MKTVRFEQDGAIGSIVLANPPFNISDWGGERLSEDKHCQHGTPPASNARSGARIGVNRAVARPQFRIR